MEGECPANTAKNTDWTYNNFESWCTARNQQFPEALCPDDVFSSKEVTCEWLCKYITETRKADDSEYTLHSLYLLLSGIQRYVCKVYPKMWFNLFSDHEFKPLKNLCDSVFKKLQSKGIWGILENTAVLPSDGEKKWWDSNVLNLETPIGLLRAVFFYNRKNFVCEVVLSSVILNYHSFREKVTVVEGQDVSLLYLYRIWIKKQARRVYQFKS